MQPANINITTMTKKYLILIILFSLTVAACSQMDTLLSAIPGPDQGIASASDTPLPEVPTTAAPTATPGISPTPTLTHTPKPTRTPRPTFTPSATMPPIVRVGPDNFPDYINPLTGLTVINPALLNRRPMAVKIPNYPHYVRPQSGISLADHVWEYYLEDGLTRFIAIFYGDDAIKVGPIRSARIFDEHIMRMYNAIFVFNGADERVLDYYKEKGLDNDLFVVERECPPLCRDNSISNYNNLFGNTTLISQYISGHGTDNSRYDLSSNFFYSLGSRGRDFASRVYVHYSYANYAYWEFDNISHRYLRYQGSVDVVDGQQEEYTLLTDSLTGYPIAADNVVILFVPHEFYFLSSDTEIFSINLVDTGKAYVFQTGRAYEALWQREAENKPISILLPDGLPFPLKPGITFFQVINNTSTTTQNDSVWEFEFVRPEK